MQNKIGIQIAGSDPGFTVFFSDGWEGEQLTHSSARKLCNGPVYYEVTLGKDYWTYVAVLCNFLSNVNREEAFKIGIRVPARMTITDSEGREVSPVALLRRITETVKERCLTRRGADTYRLRPDAQFASAGITSLAAGYSVREVWGPSLAAVPDAPGLTIISPDEECEEAVGRLPFMSGLPEAASILIGPFAEDCGARSLTPAQKAAIPSLHIKVEGRDKAYDHNIVPGETVEIYSTDCGYSPEAFEQIILTTTYNDIVNDPDRAIDYISGSHFKCRYDRASGTVFVAMSPKLLKKDFIITVDGAGDNAAAVANSLMFDGLSTGGLIHAEGLAITELRKAVADDPRFLIKKLRLPSGTPYTITSAELEGDKIKVTVEAPGSAKPEESTLLIIKTRNAVKTADAHVVIVPADKGKGNRREIFFPALSFDTSAGDTATARAMIGDVGRNDLVTVSLGTPAEADCPAFADSNGVRTADFAESGRKLGFTDRLAEVFGFGKGLSKDWQLIRIAIIAAAIAILLLGGAAAGRLATSAFDGVLPFIHQNEK